MLIRNKYSERKKDVVVKFAKIGKTDPSFQESCDINYILEKYQKTGQVPLVQQTPIYGDFSTVPDYQQSLNVIIEAEEQFANLPSDVRKKFSNDPAKFLEFVNDPENHQEMVDMGLVMPDNAEVPDVQPEPPTVPDVQPEPE